MKDGLLTWSSFSADEFEQQGEFVIKTLEMVELMALSSGEAPLASKSQGRCRLRLIGEGRQMDVPFLMPITRVAGLTSSATALATCEPHDQRRQDRTLSPGGGERRRLRQERRRDRMIQPGGSPCRVHGHGFGLLLMTQGWTLRSASRCR